MARFGFRQIEQIVDDGKQLNAATRDVLRIARMFQIAGGGQSFAIDQLG